MSAPDTTAPAHGTEPRRAPESDATRRWQGRPGLARLVRVVVVLVPFTASVAASYALSQVLPPADATAWLVARVVAIGAVAMVVLRLADRLMRRLLPLATLLDLTLVFPDQAPSRYRVALRNGAANVELQERIERYTRSGETSVASAAEHLLDLVAALSRHDRITRGHSERVRAYAQMIGEEMGLRSAELDRLRWAALIHDVGKLRVPTEILNKPGKLTEEEFSVIKWHPAWGAELAEPLAGWLGDSVLAVVQHHEKWDGSGYPKGLRGTEISLAGRIVAVADVFDVITSVRSYTAARSAADARMELARCAGTHFDPAVVRAFMSLSIGRLRRVMGPLSWLAQVSLFPQSVFATAATPVAASGTAGWSVAVAGAITATAVSTAVLPPIAPVPVTEARRPTVEAVSFSATDPGAPVVDGPVPLDAASGAASGAAPGDPEATPASTTTAPGAPGAPGALGALGASAEAAASVTTTGASPTSSVTTASVLPTSTAPSPARPQSAPSATLPATVTTTTLVTAAPVTAAPASGAPVTTAPASTVATTTTVAATTTTLPGTTGFFLFTSPVQGDTTSQEVLPMAQRLVRQLVLPNYDTDRDGDAGLTVVRGGALATGDPLRMQRFSFDPPTAIDARGRARVQLWVAAANGSNRDLGVVVAVARCADARPCVVLASGRADVEADAGAFELVTVDLGRLSSAIPASQHLEVWVVADATSESDLVLAYDAGLFDSGLWIST